MFAEIVSTVPNQIFQQTDITRPHYVSVYPAHTSRRYPESLRRRPLSLLCFYAVDILKLVGRFSEAELLLNGLLANPATRDLAALSLGDLLLLQSLWTTEIAKYEAKFLIRDLRTFAWTIPLRPGWRRVSVECALQALGEIDADFHNPDRVWLQACALMASESWSVALDHIRTYVALSGGDYTRHTAETRVVYALDRKAGLAKAITNSGRWIGMSNLSDVEIAYLKDGPRGEIDEVKQILDTVTVSATPRLINGSEVFAYEAKIRFDPVYDVTYQDAEILPSYGMIRAGSFLIAESSHMEREHWQNFTPGIIALRETHALLDRRRSARFGEKISYYFGNNANYYHWLIEDMPRLLYLQDHYSATDGFFLVDHALTGWQQDILLRLGSDPFRWRSVDFRDPNQFDRLVAPSLFSRNMCAHPAAIAILRDRLLPHATGAVPRVGNRVYLLRKGNKIRPGKLCNERDLIGLFKKAGFDFVNAGDLTFAQQIELFREAEVIAGPAGAAFTNMIFAPTGAKVLLLAPAGGACETFVSIAGAIGQEIAMCIGDSRPSPHPAWVNTTFDFSIQPTDVRCALDLLLSK